jgi:hypothetical protein
MPAQLSVHPAEQPARRILLEDGDSVVVGRDRASGLVVDDPRISKRHARLDGSSGTWTLHDLDSKNGTSVNGLSAVGQALSHGDWLSFGGVPGRFELLSAVEAQQRRSSRQARAETSVRLRLRLDEAAGPEDVLRRLLESAREVVGGERGFVLLANADGSLRVHTQSGFDPAVPRGFQGSVTAVRKVAETGRALVVCDTAAEAGLASRPSIVGPGIGALACLPLRIAGRLAGFLYADRRATTVLDDLDLEILEGLAEHASVLLGARDVRDRLHKLRASTAEATAAVLESQLRAVRVHVEPA